MKLISIFLATLLFTLSPSMAAPQGLYAYETSEGMLVGAVFGDLPADVVGDELLSAAAPVCDHVEIHQMSEDDGIMQMRKVPSIVVDKDTKLTPQGYHLMLIKMGSALKEGQSFPLTLHFKKAGERIVNIPVLSRKVK